MARFYVVATGSASGALLADVLARHRRMVGDRVRFLAGAGVARTELGLVSTELFDPTSARHVAGLAALRARCPGLEVDDELGAPVTSLGFGSDASNYRRWWVEADQRVRVVETGARAGLWRAVLAAAGAPGCTTVVAPATWEEPVAAAVSQVREAPAELPGARERGHGVDVLRWSLVRGVDEAVARRELGRELGGLVDRVVVMVHRYRGGTPPDAGPPGGSEELVAVCAGAREGVRGALARFDFGAAAGEVWRVVQMANRYLEVSRPWELSRSADPRVDSVLAVLLAACRVLAVELTPFAPGLAARVAEQCVSLADVLPQPRGVFPKL
ncbi:hypothetical protein KCV87_30570 [Actinosynnema pretiosum subsp. pretiosum]|uniref:Methionyl-tRNA synthetase n=1 Tax=Actinosynnema pretiosum subsp. pretiosum TaxID=103721 RepID=A0AA45L563_9PSEU|nr:Methionyl-tRNA synthetase [Actinosynnema pretiosum subsp. pretiosum]QUF03674.1 hypothetical protein KCV87_30570 [Actinosynnema pretiosum subsp. pretiosum]